MGLFRSFITFIWNSNAIGSIPSLGMACRVFICTVSKSILFVVWAHPWDYFNGIFPDGRNNDDLSSKWIMEVQQERHREKTRKDIRRKAGHCKSLVLKGGLIACSMKFSHSTFLWLLEKSVFSFFLATNGTTIH